MTCDHFDRLNDFDTAGKDNQIISDSFDLGPYYFDLPFRFVTAYYFDISIKKKKNYNVVSVKEVTALRAAQGETALMGSGSKEITSLPREVKRKGSGDIFDLGLL